MLRAAVAVGGRIYSITHDSNFTMANCLLLPSLQPFPGKMGNQKRGKCWVRDWNPSARPNVTSDPAEASTSQPDNYFVGDSGSEGEMDVDQHDGGSDELQLHIESAPEVGSNK